MGQKRATLFFKSNYQKTISRFWSDFDTSDSPIELFPQQNVARKPFLAIPSAENVNFGRKSRINFHFLF